MEWVVAMGCASIFQVISYESSTMKFYATMLILLLTVLGWQLMSEARYHEPRDVHKSKKDLLDHLIGVNTDIHSLDSAQHRFSTAAARTPFGKEHAAEHRKPGRQALHGTQYTLHAASTDIQEGCPAWMAEYAEYHAQQRGQPDARYLIHSVRRGRSGLGDRIRGMMFATRLAAASRRVVLFTWRSDPEEPQAFFTPAGRVNWTLAGTGYSEATAVAESDSDQAVGASTGTGQGSSLVLDLYTWRREQQETLQKVKHGLLNNLGNVQYVTIHTNERAEAPCTACPPLSGPLQIASEAAEGTEGAAGSSSNSRSSAACLFRLLFKPSAELQQAADRVLLQLYGRDSLAPGFAFVAAHLRMGGLGHEGHLVRDRGTGRGDLVDVITAVNCSSHLAQAVGVDTRQVPVLLITDNHILRGFIISGGLTRAVTPRFLPAHMARLDDHEKAGRAALATFIDVVLLARAQCLVASDSGFSETAWLLGGGKECLRRLKAKGRWGCGADVPNNPLQS